MIQRIAILSLFIISLWRFGNAQTGPVNNEFIVLFHSATTQAQIDQVISDWNATIIDITPLTKIYLLEFPNGTSLDDVVNIGGSGTSGSTAVIDDVINNYVIESSPVNTNIAPHLSDVSNYNPISDCPIYPTNIQGSFGENSVNVAIIDTGFDFMNQANLLGNQGTGIVNFNCVGRYRDVTTNTILTDCFDNEGHGTSVAGILLGSFLAEGKGNLLNLGVYKALDNTGTGNLFDALMMVDQAIMDGANIVNLSWGFNSPPGNFNYATVRRLFKIANANNTLLIFSAGNTNQLLDYFSQYQPASSAYSEEYKVIVVGASNCFGGKASFSNYGNSVVDVFAPGVNIYCPNTGGGWTYKSGTSFATPIITTIAAAFATQSSSFDLFATYCKVVNSISDNHPMDNLAVYGLSDTDNLPNENCSYIENESHLRSENENLPQSFQLTFNSHSRELFLEYSNEYGINDNVRITIYNNIGLKVGAMEVNGLNKSSPVVSLTNLSLSLPVGIYHLAVESKYAIETFSFVVL